MKKQLFNKWAGKGIPIVALLMILPLLTISCGSGGGGSNVAGGGVSGTGVSSGTITGFGSVILNNSTYEVTPSTGITVNDISGLSQGDLAIGMVALVEFTGSSATSITADNELKGTVDAVDTANNVVTVMGTQVIVDNSTVFDNIAPASIAGLSAGDNVEVHGLFDFQNNSIRATRIEKLTAAPGPGEFEVKGTISSFDVPAGKFKIGNLFVDYDDNNVQLPAGTGNGSFVEAKGTLSGGELVAVSVETEDEAPDANPGNLFEIEGIVASVTNPSSPTHITINNQTILIIGAQFENGTAADLTPGVRVEVEGLVNTSGTFAAKKIEFEDSVKVETTVDSVDTINNIITVLGTVTVRVTAFTELEDERDGTPNFSINDIQPNDFVEIQGFPDGAGSMVAIEVERDNDPGESILQGALQSVNDPDFTILGITVETSGGTEFEINEAATTATNFFNTVQTGDIVKARERPSVAPLNTITADSVSLEGEDD